MSTISSFPSSILFSCTPDILIEDLWISNTSDYPNLSSDLHTNIFTSLIFNHRYHDIISARVPVNSFVLTLGAKPHRDWLGRMMRARWRLWTPDLIEDPTAPTVHALSAPRLDGNVNVIIKYDLLLCLSNLFMYTKVDCTIQTVARCSFVLVLKA